MDVRHFAFLARQPSAALKPRDSFFGLPKRGLVLILANALFWQPLLAQAEGIVVSAAEGWRARKAKWRTSIVIFSM